MDTEAAELSEEEALAQFELWTSKLTEARAARAKFDQLVEGYSKMLEGLNLLYPNLSELATAAPPPVIVMEGSNRLTVVPAVSGRVNGSVPSTSIISENSTRISSTKTVRAILEDLGPDARSTTRDIYAEVQRRCIKLESDNPLTVVRKALAAGVKKGWINSEDRDKRTKVYWINSETETATSPVNDSGPADEAGPGEASDDESPHQGDVIAGAFGPSLPMR